MDIAGNCLAAVLIYFLVRNNNVKFSTNDNQTGRAQDILKERLARSEIDEAEYDRIRNIINN